MTRRATQIAIGRDRLQRFRIIKSCACGQTFVQAQWEKLDLVGTPVYEWGEKQELRNCVCGSTLAIITEKGRPE